MEFKPIHAPKTIPRMHCKTYFNSFKLYFNILLVI